MANATTYERFSSEGKAIRRKRKKQLNKLMKSSEETKETTNEYNSAYYDYKRRNARESSISRAAAKTSNTNNPTLWENNNEGKLITNRKIGETLLEVDAKEPINQQENRLPPISIKSMLFFNFRKIKFSNIKNIYYEVIISLLNHPDIDSIILFTNETQNSNAWINCYNMWFDDDIPTLKEIYDVILEEAEMIRNRSATINSDTSGLID